MAVEQKLYTADDLWNLTAGIDKSFELINGVLVETYPMYALPGIITADIGSMIVAHVHEHHLGYAFAKTGCILSRNPDTVLAPNISFVAKQRLSTLTDKYLDFAPDLAVEVISLNNNQVEIHEKIIAYFGGGTRMVWIVYPRSRAIYVYTSATEVTILGVNDSLEGGAVLPGFKVDVAQIFEVLDS
jgi:Uma2 family endonuclease